LSYLRIGGFLDAELEEDVLQAAEAESGEEVVWCVLS
jgi:hypothetical protein